MIKTNQVILVSRPKGIPTIANFKTESITLPNVGSDEVLLQSNYFSVDPYMRGRMNASKSYAEPFQINKPINGGATATVLESKSSIFKKGDIVVGMLPWQEKLVVSEIGLQKIDVKVVPESYYLSVLGMTGLTAYFGLTKIGKPKKGDTIVISGAAGAVGVVAGQIAKIYGCEVVGIAGTDEKVKFLKNKFGFDHAINYNTSDHLQKEIAQFCPNGVDIYFDNVGGEISDAVIANINFKSKIILCGQIALYNAIAAPIGPRVQPTLLSKSALMQGFIVSNFTDDFPDGIKQLSDWVTTGKIKFTETVKLGFNNLPRAFISLFNGDNTGKMIVKV